ncbi:hypothetical protein CEXT_669411 [Caerostris extrusa]|uniref:Uncharacterized protein n=1 Tax=Caerostris extrusa TaxID=172846 RepID=A0AAV4NAP3_CAEEX|nr:hypothetical protein CEXT_669411 [Caerostris extrusa]
MLMPPLLRRRQTRETSRSILVPPSATISLAISRKKPRGDHKGSSRTRTMDDSFVKRRARNPLSCILNRRHLFVRVASEIKTQLDSREVPLFRE